MDPHDEDLSKNSYEEIYKLYVQKLNKFSADTQLATPKSQEYLQLLKCIENAKCNIQCEQNLYTRPPEPRNSEREIDNQTASSRTNKYVHNFGRAIEAYPITFECLPADNKDKKQSTDLKDTDKDIPSDKSSDSMDVLLSPSHSISIIVKDIGHEVQRPCEKLKPKCPLSETAPPKCPPPPKCSPQPPKCVAPPNCPRPTCEYYNIKFECGTQDVVFKLKCKEQRDDEHPNSTTYDCKLLDEKECLDMVIAMAATDLKCKRVQAIHSLHSLMLAEDTKDTQGSIDVTEAEIEKEDKRDPDPADDDVLER